MGYGADALAFRFNRAGILAAPPAYVVQGLPNEFYLRRLGPLVRGRSSFQEVRAFFGRPNSVERRSDGFNCYYDLPVYNSFEDRWGSGKR